MWIETDLEPDDVLALYILPKAEYYVVGEGNANIKYNRMIQYSKLLETLNATIIQGMNSDKDFVLDGKEFDDLTNDICYTDYMTEFKRFCKLDNPIMVSLKPMRELLDEYNKDPTGIKNLVSNITLYVYGSFNFRCILGQYKTQLLDLLSAFKKVCLYESYYVSGSNNSINKTNTPELYELISKTNNAYFKLLLKLTHNWNISIIEDCRSTLNSENCSSDTAERENKIINSILGNEDFQFVIADFGLAAIYDKIEPIPITNLNFDNWYTAFKETTEPTSLYAFRNVPMSTIVDNLIEKITVNI